MTLDEVPKNRGHPSRTGPTDNNCMVTKDRVHMHSDDRLGLPYPYCTCRAIANAARNIPEQHGVVWPAP